MIRRPRRGALAALLLTVPLLLTGGCGSPNISGDSNPGSQVDATPAPPPS